MPCVKKLLTSDIIVRNSVIAYLIAIFLIPDKRYA